MGTVLTVIKLLMTLFDFAKWAKEAWGEKVLNDFLRGVEETVDGLKKAQTPEQKSEAAKKMVDLIRRIPS